MKKTFIVFILTFVLLFLTSCTGYQSKYEKLYDDYLDLEERYEHLYNEYEDLSIAVSKTEDYIVTLSRYFNKDDWFEYEYATYEEAAEAYSKISSIIYPFY